MGLYASFTPEQLGYPVSLMQTLMGDVITVDIEYQAACEAFCETFLDVALDLVPVDTGYLESTIEASTDGFFCECYADAEYAQYVEYGTWKMDAQPYFTPALEAGLEAFQELAGEAVDEAMEEMRDICEDIMAAAANNFSEEFIGNAVDMIMVGLLGLFPLLLQVYGILDSLNLATGNSRDFGTGGGAGVDVIIT